MQFGLFGSVVQMGFNTEGEALWRAGLLHKIWKDIWVDGIEPTARLEAMFDPMPPLEDLYPVLVEYVMIYKYQRHPGFVDAEDVVRRLGALGITAEGLKDLKAAVTRALGR